MCFLSSTSMTHGAGRRKSHVTSRSDAQPCSADRFSRLARSGGGKPGCCSGTRRTPPPSAFCTCRLKSKHGTGRDESAMKYLSRASDGPAKTGDEPRRVVPFGRCCVPFHVRVSTAHSLRAATASVVRYVRVRGQFAWTGVRFRREGEA